MLHNGIYFLEEKDKCFGLDPQNLLLFQMSPLTREIIQHYPHIESLSPRFPAEKVQETIAILKKNNIIKTTPPTLPVAPPWPPHYSDFAILLDTKEGKETLMSRDTLGQTIDFFLKETSAVPLPSLSFIITGEEEPLIPLITEGIQRIRGAIGPKVRLILRIPGFPFSLNMLSLVKQHHLFLNLTFFPPPGVTLLQHLQAQTTTWQSKDYQTHRKLLATINRLTVIRLDPVEMEDIPGIVGLFETNGLTRLHLDWLCQCCETLHPHRTTAEPIVPVVPFTEGLLRYRYLKDKEKGRHVAGFMNHFPLLQTLIASQRSFSGCFAAIGYCVINPDGELYPCLGLVDDPTCFMGNIGEGFIPHHREKLSQQRVESRPSCLTCWGRYVCGGGSNIKDITISKNACHTFLSLLQHILPWYGSLDMMDKNIILDNRQQLDLYLPYLKKSSVAHSTEFKETRVLMVRSDSMKPLLKTGDHVTVAPLDGKKLRIGDIICYGHPIICHRVIARFKQKGELYIIEKGDSIWVGKKIAAREISGRVIAIRTPKKQYNITSPSWRVINFFIALASRCSHLGTVMFFHLLRRGRP